MRVRAAQVLGSSEGIRIAENLGFQLLTDQLIFRSSLELTRNDPAPNNPPTQIGRKHH
jgi:hypothetical protein